MTMTQRRKQKIVDIIDENVDPRISTTFEDILVDIIITEDVDTNQISFDQANQTSLDLANQTSLSLAN